jgi:hypothetical protein
MASSSRSGAIFPYGTLELAQQEIGAPVGNRCHADDPGIFRLLLGMESDAGADSAPAAPVAVRSTSIARFVCQALGSPESNISTPTYDTAGQWLG